MNTGVIMLAIIAVSGVTILFNFDEIFAPVNETSKAGTGSMLVGNVEVIQRDGSGNIIAYRQGSNHIVLGGMELIARQVFGPGAAGVDANNTNTTGFDPGLSRNYGGGVVQYMSIGNGTNAGDCTSIGTSPKLGFDNMTLECPLHELPATTCARELALITRFNASDTIPTSGAAQLNLTAVATFSGAGGAASCAAQNIGEAGIWTNGTGGPDFYTNGPANDNIMFARNTFGTVNLSVSDSLELTWKFTFTDN